METKLKLNLSFILLISVILIVGDLTGQQFVTESFVTEPIEEKSDTLISTNNIKHDETEEGVKEEDDNIIWRKFTRKIGKKEIIEGIIVDDNGFVYPGTYVQLDDQPKIETGPYGDFKFKNVPLGIHNIKVEIDYIDQVSNDEYKYSFQLRNIRVGPGERINLGVIDPKLNKDIYYAKDFTEEEKKQDVELREMQDEIEKEEVEKFKTEIGKKGKYYNVFSRKKGGMRTDFPLVREALYRSFLPGLGQLYNKRKARGWIYFSTSSASLISFLVFRICERVYDKRYRESDDMHNLIEEITFNKRKICNRGSNISLGIFYGIWITSLFDAIIDSMIVSKKIKKKLKISSVLNDDSIKLGINYSF